MTLEIQILQFLQDIRTPFIDVMMKSITMIGDIRFLILLLSIIYWCMDKRFGKYLMWTVMFSGVLNGGIKELVRRPRPYVVGAVKPVIITEQMGYAFPSGHTQVATSFWGSSMAMFGNKGVIVVGVIMTVLVAISRVYLGVHWPSDVIFGIIIGIVSILISNRLLDVKKGVNRKHIIGAVILVGAVIILPVSNHLVEISGGLLGLIIGMYLEEGNIRFKERQKIDKQITKAIIGLVGIGIVYWLITSAIVLMPISFLYLLRGICVMLWIVAGAPYIYAKYIEKENKNS